MTAHNRTILIIEDNPDDVELTLRAFEQHKIASIMVVARDGEEALDYLFAKGAHAGRDTSSLPRVVLLDIGLPVMDGHEVLRRLRMDVRTRLLPVVILTSSGEERDIVGTYTLGANSYIRKPVDFAQFASVASQLGVYWLTVNEVLPPLGRLEDEP